MALILAAPASGKSTFVKRNISAAILDGDDVIFNCIGVPVDRPDPADWTDDERHAHMDAFQTQALTTGKICIAFSKVSIGSFDTRGLPTVAVEVPYNMYSARVASRRQNLRKGCKPRSDSFYNSQRAYTRKLAEAHGLRVYTNFESAVAAIKAGDPWIVPVNNLDGIHTAIAHHGFCVVPGLLSRASLLEIEAARCFLVTSGAKMSNHLSTRFKADTDKTAIRLSDTIHQYLNPHMRQDRDVTTLHVARRLLPLVDSLLNVRANEHAYLFNDAILAKTKEHTCRLHWHQDFSFWPLQINSVVFVVWVPLVPVFKTNGAVSVAVGSHRCPTGPIINLSSGIPSCKDEGNVIFDKNNFQTVCLEMNAGDGIIFHPNLYHMSHPNTTDSTRVAWSSVWVHPESRWDTTRVPTHPRSKEVTHGSRLGHFDWEHMPK